MEGKILVMVVLKSGRNVEAWLEVRDQGKDLRFYETKTKRPIDVDTVRDWVLRLPSD